MLREGELGTVKANNPLKILIYSSTSTGPSRDQGPGQWKKKKQIKLFNFISAPQLVNSNDGRNIDRSS